MKNPSAAAVLDRVEKRLEKLSMSENAASVDAGGSRDLIRSIRRGLKSGKQRGVSTVTIEKLALVLKTPNEWLAWGKGPEEAQDHIDSEDVAASIEPTPPRTVPIKGYVGAGEVAHYYAVAQGDLDTVPAPEDCSDTTVAVEIKGTSLGEIFDRWLIFYDDVRAPVTSDLIGQLCIVGLADDRILVKKIQRGTAGRYVLKSNTEDPIMDAEIIWAAKVNHMRPR